MISQKDEIEKIAEQAQLAAKNLQTKTVRFVYREMKSCEQQKKDITDVFYGKVNILLTMSSIILSMNIILLTYFIQGYDFTKPYIGIIVYVTSSLSLLTVLYILIRNMRFKKEYLEINELKYVKEISQLNNEEDLMRTQIATIITRNYKRNRNIEEMKTSMKQVTLLMSLSLLLMVISSAYIWRFDQVKHNSLEITRMPVMKLLYDNTPLDKD